MPAPVIFLSLAVPVADRSSKPVCTTVSHERLIVRAERDVCAPTVNRDGRAVAMGFMPTRCADETHDYRIDAAGIADRCVVPTRRK